MTNKRIKQLITMLEDVSSGELAIDKYDDPADVFLGCVRYELENGWHIVVYNDSGRWDYIDSFRTPDGKQLRPWNDTKPAIQQNSPLLWRLLNWHPYHVDMERWGWKDWWR